MNSPMWKGEKPYKGTKPKPSTLGQQIKAAQKEWASWSPEKRASVRLEGNSGLRPMSERGKP